MWYDILGISPDATVGEIKKAYAALIKTVDQDTELERFNQIHGAYQTALKLKKKKKKKTVTFTYEAPETKKGQVDTTKSKAFDFDPRRGGAEAASEEPVEAQVETEVPVVGGEASRSEAEMKVPMRTEVHEGEADSERSEHYEPEDDIEDEVFVPVFVELYGDLKTRYDVQAWETAYRYLGLDQEMIDIEIVVDFFNQNYHLTYEVWAFLDQHYGLSMKSGFLHRELISSSYRIPFDELSVVDELKREVYVNLHVEAYVAFNALDYEKCLMILDQFNQQFTLTEVLLRIRLIIASDLQRDELFHQTLELLRTIDSSPSTTSFVESAYYFRIGETSKSEKARDEIHTMVFEHAFKRMDHYFNDSKKTGLLFRMKRRVAGVAMKTSLSHLFMLPFERFFLRRALMMNASLVTKFFSYSKSVPITVGVLLVLGPILYANISVYQQFLDFMKSVLLKG